MNPYTNDPELDAIIKTQVEALHPDLRRLLEDPATGIYIQNFCARAGFTDEQTSDLEHEIIMLILGVTALDDFAFILMTELEMQPKQAFAIEHWVTGNLLKDVLRYLGGSSTTVPAPSPVQKGAGENVPATTQISRTVVEPQRKEVTPDVQAHISIPTQGSGPTPTKELDTHPIPAEQPVVVPSMAPQTIYPPTTPAAATPTGPQTYTQQMPGQAPYYPYPPYYYPPYGYYGAQYPNPYQVPGVPQTTGMEMPSFYPPVPPQFIPPTPQPNEVQYAPEFNGFQEQNSIPTTQTPPPQLEDQPSPKTPFVPPIPKLKSFSQPRPIVSPQKPITEKVSIPNIPPIKIPETPKTVAQPAPGIPSTQKREVLAPTQKGTVSSRPPKAPEPQSKATTPIELPRKLKLIAIPKVTLPPLPPLPPLKDIQSEPTPQKPSPISTPPQKIIIKTSQKQSEPGSDTVISTMFGDIRRLKPLPPL